MIDFLDFIYFCAGVVFVAGVALILRIFWNDKPEKEKSEYCYHDFEDEF